MIVAAFRIGPRESSLYYTVKVFSTLKAMRTFAHQHDRAVGFNTFKGLATSFWEVTYTKQKPVTTRRAGELLLVRGHLGGEVVSHECAHLALAWARRRKIDPMARSGTVNVSDDEERFCYALGEMVRQTYLALYKQKILQ